VIVVSNATPLIALSKITHLALLQELFGTVLIPEAVYDEVVTRASGRPGSAEVQQADWIQKKAVTDRTKIDYLRADLDPGEAEALVLAEELDAAWVLLDEPKARLAAELLGLKFIGTLGLLVLGKNSGKLEKLRPLLDDLRAKRFHECLHLSQCVGHDHRVAVQQ
jgi:uncharacterized protein